MSADRQERVPVSVDVQCSDEESNCLKAEAANHVRVTNEGHATDIVGNFLGDIDSLHCVDGSHLSLGIITTVNIAFLASCASLTKVDLSGLTNVTSIDECFLYRCSSLTTVDLCSFGSVTCIGDSFLRECSSLTAVNLCALQNVASVGNNFLYGCTSLSEADFTAFTKVALIDEGFLNHCSSLVTINLQSFTSVTAIGGGFLFDCSSLASVDLCALENLTSIPPGFLFGCTSLTAINLGTFKNVTSIDNDFLYRCTSLTDVNFHTFTRLVSIKDAFLGECTSLTDVDFTALENVKSIGKRFLYCCTSLKTVDLSAFHKVTAIGEDFLTLCLAAKRIIVAYSSFSLAGMSLCEIHQTLTVCKVPAMVSDARAVHGVPLLLSNASSSLKVANSKVDFFPHKQLGSGGIGCVYNGLCYGAPVAVKKMSCLTEAERRELIDFAAISALCGHPNLLPVSCWAESDDIDVGSCLLLVTPLVIPGSMVNVASTLTAPLGYDDWGIFGKRQVLTMTFEIAAALDFLADKNLVHHGVKPQNILLRRNADSPSGVPFQAILSDFGHTSIAARRMLKWSAIVSADGIFETPGGDIKSLSPPCVDVVALGHTIMWAMQTGEGEHRLARGTVTCANKGDRLPPDGDLTLFKSLLSRMVHGEPQRPAAAEVVHEIRSILGDASM